MGSYYFRRDPGILIHFIQMHITQMEFADESFDSVVSHIAGHETTGHGLPLMIGESWRVWNPGGVMFHADAANQPERLGLCDQVLNDFQAFFNGEPFWMGWADAAVPGILRQVDIPEAAAFAEYLAPPERRGQWNCYGARKPAAS